MRITGTGLTLITLGGIASIISGILTITMIDAWDGEMDWPNLTDLTPENAAEFGASPLEEKRNLIAPIVLLDTISATAVGFGVLCRR